MSGIRYFFRLKEIIGANILIFARKQNEARKTKCFTEYEKGFLKIAKCMKGEIMMNHHTQPIFSFCDGVCVPGSDAFLCLGVPLL